jgi:HEAT repeat protein
MQCLDDQDPAIASYAARAVGAIQQQPATVVPALIRVLERVPRNSRGFNLRSATIWALKEFGTNADAAVFRLQWELAGTSEDNYQVLNELITVLTSVSAQPERIVPSLTPFLQSTNEHLRQRVVYSLSAMGGRAQFALPSLTNALQFSRTRHVVEFAIRKISSDGATNSVAEVPGRDDRN